MIQIAVNSILCAENIQRDKPMNEKIIKEMCKQIVDRRNDLNEFQKEVLKEAIEQSQNLEQLLYTAIASNFSGR